MKVEGQSAVIPELRPTREKQEAYTIGQIVLLNYSLVELFGSSRQSYGCGPLTM